MELVTSNQQRPSAQSLVQTFTVCCAGESARVWGTRGDLQRSVQVGCDCRHPVPQRVHQVSTPIFLLLPCCTLHINRTQSYLLHKFCNCHYSKHLLCSAAVFDIVVEASILALSSNKCIAFRRRYRPLTCCFSVPSAVQRSLSPLCGEALCSCLIELDRHSHSTQYTIDIEYCMACRGKAKGSAMPQDAVQALDVALKNGASNHPDCVTLPRAFFFYDPNLVKTVGGGAEVKSLP